MHECLVCTVLIFSVFQTLQSRKLSTFLCVHMIANYKSINQTIMIMTVMKKLLWIEMV